MRFRSLLVALGVVGLSATRMSAQACAGAAAFSSGPFRLGASLAKSEDVKSFGATVAMGANAGPFATGTLSRSVYSTVDDSGMLFGLGAGYGIDLNATHTAQFCPRAVFDYQSGPDIDGPMGTITTSGHAFGFGGSIGGAYPVAPTLDFVPFLGASYVTTRASATLNAVTESVSEDYTAIDVGAGFVLNKTLTLQPSFSIPFGLDSAKPTVLLAVSFNFGLAKP